MLHLKFNSLFTFPRATITFYNPCRKYFVFTRHYILISINKFSRIIRFNIIKVQFNHFE